MDARVHGSLDTPKEYFAIIKKEKNQNLSEKLTRGTSHSCKIYQWLINIYSTYTHIQPI